tara:strand:- start:171 stop:389 length:219 start_codon:yes stop_codon:yes gene_type:complete
MAANKNNNDPKPGWKSTEFWVTVVVALASLAWGAGIVDPAGDSGADKTFGFVCSALSALGYTVSRGMAKKKA